MLPFCASFTKMKKPLESTFYNKWMILPKLPNSLITFMSGTEFTCGSVPNLKSTRGLLFGAAYSGGLVFTLIGCGVATNYSCIGVGSRGTPGADAPP